MEVVDCDAVSVCVKSRCSAPIVTWCTVDGCKTQTFGNAAALATPRNMSGQYCLVTVMQPNKHMQIQPRCAFFLNLTHAPRSTCRIKHSGIELAFTNCIAKDCTKMWQQQLVRTGSNAVNYFAKFVKKNQLVLDPRHHVNAYCNPVMMEADMFLGGKYSPMSTLTGWPQSNRISINDVHFVRSVVYACILTQCDTAAVACSSLPPAVADVLISSCLTAFAGNYPERPELTDDRTCGSLKLNTNRDCDDMAITVCGVFNALKRRGFRSYTQDSALAQLFDPDTLAIAEKVLQSMLSRYKTAACIVCEAVPHIANPNISGDHDGSTIGHVFAVLCCGVENSPKMFSKCIVIESTRQSSPHATPLNVHAIDSKPIFCRMPLYATGQQGIQCVKPFVSRQYPYCMAAYTNTHSFLLADSNNRVGVPIDTLANGASNAVLIDNVPADAAYCNIAHKVCHRIDYAALDQACARHKWSSMLGIHNGESLRSPQQGSNWMYAVDPARQKVKPLTLSRWTAYGLLAPPP